MPARALFQRVTIPLHTTPRIIAHRYRARRVEGQAHTPPEHRAHGLPERPNLVLLITDQQRAAQHWPEDPAWLAELCPHDAELRRHGLTFTRAFTATAMCSPSRACLMTGKRPSRHGVTLTLTEGDLWPDRRNAPAALRTALRMGASGEIPRARLATELRAQRAADGPQERQRAGAAAGHRHARHAASQPRLPRRDEGQVAPQQARGRRALGRRPTPSGSSATTASPNGSRRTRAATPRPHNFGGGNAGTSHEGWDEDYTRQMESLARPRAASRSPSAWSSRSSTPTTCSASRTPTCSGGYGLQEFRGLGVPLPASIDEDLREKPAVQALSRLGMDNYLGPLPDLQAKQDYVDFYAYLHRVVDAQIGRLLRALGPARGRATRCARARS